MLTTSTSWLVKNCCDPVAEEEPNKFILGQKEPLIAEWSYIVCSPKHLDTSRTVYDVGDLVGIHDFVSKALKSIQLAVAETTKYGEKYCTPWNGQEAVYRYGYVLN
jgi:hypothetical protein